MPRPLATIADEVIRLGEIPEGVEDARRVDALVKQLKLERPDVTTAGAQRAAYKALGVEAPPTSIPDKPARPRSRGRKRKRRRVPRVRVAPASTFGSVIMQMFALVALYWAIRSAGAVGTILDRVRLAARWLIEPVGWGQLPR